MSKPEWKQLHQATRWEELSGAFDTAESLGSQLPKLAKPKKATADFLYDLVGNGYVPSATGPALDVVSLMVACGDTPVVAEVLVWLGDVGDDLLQHSREEPSHHNRGLGDAAAAFQRALDRLRPLAQDPEFGPKLAHAEAVAAQLPGAAADAIETTATALQQRYATHPNDLNSTAYMVALAALGRPLALTEDAPIEHRVVAALVDPTDDPALAELLVPNWKLVRKLSRKHSIPSDSPHEYLAHRKPETAVAVLSALPKLKWREADALVRLAEGSRRYTDHVTQGVLRLTKLKPRHKISLLSRLGRSPQVLDELHAAATRIIAESRKPQLSELDEDACLQAAYVLFQAGDPRWIDHLLLGAKHWADLAVPQDDVSFQLMLFAVRDEFGYHPALVEPVGRYLTKKSHRGIALDVICSWPRAEAAALLPQVRAVAPKADALGAVAVAHLTGEAEDWQHALAKPEAIEVFTTILKACPHRDWPQFLDLLVDAVETDDFGYHPAQMLDLLVEHGRLTPDQAWSKLQELFQDSPPQQMAEALGLVLGWADQGRIDRSKVLETLADVEPDSGLMLDVVTALLRHGETVPLDDEALVALLREYLDIEYARNQVIECAGLILARSLTQAEAVRSWLVEVLASDTRIDVVGYPIPADEEACQRIKTIIDGLKPES